MKNKKTEGKISVIVAIVLLFAITVLSMSYIVCKDIDQPANIQITITDTRPELNSHGKEQFVFTPQKFNDPNDVERMTLKIERLVSDSWEQKSDGFTYKIQAIIAVTAIFFTLLVVVVSLFQYLKTKQFDSEFKELKNEIDKLNDIKDKFDDQKKLTDKIIEFNVKTAQYSEATSHYLDALSAKDNLSGIKYYTNAIKNLNTITKMEKLENYLADFEDMDNKIKERTNDLKYRAHNNRGALKVTNRDLKSALKDYDEAIKLNPNYAMAYFNKGRLKSNYKEAIQNYDEAIKLNPNYAMAYNNRGNLKNDKGEFKEAMDDYNKAIELNPNYAIIYNNRGTLKASNVNDDKDKFEEAMDDYNKAIELNPNYFEAFCNRGVLKINNKNKSEALLDFNKAIELNPNYAMAYGERGLLKSDDDIKSALADYNKAIKLFKAKGDIENLKKTQDLKDKLEKEMNK